MTMSKSLKDSKQAILVLGNSDSGLYDFRKEVLGALMDRGFAVHVSVPDTGYVGKIRALGCVCHDTVMERRGMNPLKDLKLFSFYLRLIKEIKPAAVFTYTIKPNIYGGMACRMKKVPYLVNITGLGTTLEHEGVLQRMIVLLYRTSLKKAGCIFFQNRQNRDFMQEKGCVAEDAATKVISGSGVNLKEYTPKPYPKDKQVRFVSVMRIMKDKGIGELLETAETIHREYPDTLFEILGAYEEESRSLYEPRIEDLQSRGIVRYYGYRDDVPDFYAHCQAVIHPSWHEGMSNVLQEAAATGRPVIAGNISGCKEIFEDGVSGIAFSPKNAESLTNAVRAFLSLSDEDRASMGQKARAHVEAYFDREKVVQAYLDTLFELIK
ncbi:MAG: glycosyltransferase family 4 protein [Eubacteriales bacterium]|nr:glycosyltransferase family 4 protein [Eubacteriales bacterium]